MSKYTDQAINRDMSAVKVMGNMSDYPDIALSCWAKRHITQVILIAVNIGSL